MKRWKDGNLFLAFNCAYKNADKNEMERKTETFYGDNIILYALIKQPEKPSLEKFLKILINELWNIVESFLFIKQRAEKDAGDKKYGDKRRKELENNIYKTEKHVLISTYIVTTM